MSIISSYVREVNGAFFGALMLVFVVGYCESEIHYKDHNHQNAVSFGGIGIEKEVLHNDTFRISRLQGVATDFTSDYALTTFNFKLKTLRAGVLNYFLVAICKFNGLCILITSRAP